jgi:hypothetical protein
LAEFGHYFVKMQQEAAVALEFFVFGSDSALSAFAIMPDAMTSLAALQQFDPVGYEICVAASADLVEHVVRFLNNDTSECIPTDVIKWWCGTMTEKYPVLREKMRLEFSKGYPRSLIRLDFVKSSLH